MNRDSGAIVLVLVDFAEKAQFIFRSITFSNTGIVSGVYIPFNEVKSDAPIIQGARRSFVRETRVGDGASRVCRWRLGI